MRTAMAFAMLLVAAAAVANPIAADLYIDFDPPNHLDTILYPTPYITYEAYVMMELVGFFGQDVYAISFDVEMLFGNNIITGDFVPAYGAYIVQIVDNGITVIAEDCISEPTAVLGYVPVFYTGVADAVHIVPHIYNGHTYVTCGDMVEHDWCYVMDGGLGMYPDMHAYCGNPVENVAWGAIKAMYR